MYSTNGMRARRVLIADDDPVIRRWLTSTLISDGYSVVAMSDGREAYRFLQSDADFRGAILDLAMPYLDGPDLIRFMRTEKRLMRIPVMLITAEQDMAQVANGFAAGATVLLPKPFTKQRLQSALRMMLGQQLEVSTTSLPTAVRGFATTSLIEETKDESFAPETLIESETGDRSSQAMQPVDLTVLHSLEDYNDDPDSDLIVELIDLYRENGTRQVDEIKAAAAKMDEELLKQSAHALKGSSWTMGAGRVGQLCAQLEQLVRPGSNEAAELVRNLEKEFVTAGEVFAGERHRRLVPAFA